ncbi:alpha/beta fold hydrolase [Mycolicibacterium celeriflavum]|uniref:Alpha/beta hydrolase n=1 Tax=Mycolicibacterium celeriflavum TaxID=1249101 RepID=A0A1X0C329_MYCCF|nr:alpha/beta hydrolase [Mycolicibacterium celeriflavum]MCV7239540.1 alpha/beta hydrolase [Mycolicibacterium celeriflavum]ORA51853.1 alpha/beta hydrolase [Mycolicibacterium celeriflavum]BBY43230.1 alpha/beta hydrolase [Mycolicibacterium celeriflavum]
MSRSTVELSWGAVSYLKWAPEKAGSAPTVLLLHGGGVDSASLSWDGVGPRLAAGGYRVLAPDHPGYGQSPPAPWPSTQDQLVGYVGDFVDALGLDRYAIGGLSLGGGMTIGHVLDRPETVTGAMLLGSYGFMSRLSEGPLSGARQAMTWAMLRTGLLGAVSRWSGRSRRAMAWIMPALIGDPAQRTPELVDEILSAARADHAFDAFGQWQRDQVRWNRLTTDYRARLATFPRPALVIHGDNDTSVPVAAARAAADLMPDVRLEVVEGAAHWVQRDRPDVVVPMMLEFLDTLNAEA